jgi:ankyrin repeat protein
VDHQDGKVVGAEREDPEGVRVFELLLDSGADLYAVNKYGQSVLHIAAQSNSGQLIKKILEIDYGKSWLISYRRNPYRIAI